MMTPEMKQASVAVASGLLIVGIGICVVATAGICAGVGLATGAVAAAFVGATANVVAVHLQPGSKTAEDLYLAPVAGAAGGASAILAGPALAIAARGVSQTLSKLGSTSMTGGTVTGSSVVQVGAGSSKLATPAVQSAKLQNIVNNLYKGTTNTTRAGNGTTMDAVRSELATGLPTGGKMHTMKAEESLRGLENWLLKNPDALAPDRLVARSLADELMGVLGK
ncbi:hypothetical protein [Microbacterium sp. RU33B]|uniref:hypothetical protein n=1 Tax=Microbacterium sp. RU33B TaxID=1907390 RepID=UPI00117F586D|nr:hypothetical protein [Microbacterium sp. RU33B]